MKLRKTAATLTISAALMTISRAYETPKNIEDFYKKMFPLTEKVETVAQTQVDGNLYYIVWGTTRPNDERPDDTDGCFKVDPSGGITRINGSTPADFPYWYIEDRAIWRPLLQSFVEWEIETSGGIAGLEGKLYLKTAITEPLAEAYEENGIKVPDHINIIVNEKGDFKNAKNVEEVLNNSSESPSTSNQPAPRPSTPKNTTTEEPKSHSMEW